MDKLAMALRLAEEGFFVFPLGVESKRAAIKGWPLAATRDPDQIREWWGMYPRRNIGIFTEKFGEDKALLVVDVDVKEDKNGEETLLQLDLDGNELPDPHMEVKTPGGGRHLIYIVDEPVKSGVDVLGPGLDIRSRGGYIVAPGSEV